MAGLLDYLSGAGDIINTGIDLFGLFQGSNQNKAAINLLQQQYDLQKQQSDRAWQLATANRTDAYGNQVGYDPATGFTTNVSPSVQALLNAELGELTQRNTTDAAIRRAGLLANQTRRQQEGVAADEALGRYRFEDTYDRDAVIGDLMSSSLSAMRRGTDDIVNPALTQLTRMGDGSSAARLLADLAEGNADRVNEALVNARVQGNQLYEQLAGSRGSRLGNEYNLLASRASNFEDVPFVPQNISSGLANQQGAIPGAALGASQLGVYGTQGAAQQLAAAAQGGTMDYSQLGRSVNSLLTGLGGFSELDRDTNVASRRTRSSSNTVF